MTEPLLSPDTAIPIPPEHAEFVLEPLGEEHNQSDLEAWGSSIEHIRSTPGMGGRDWPPDGPYTVEQNLADMRMHVADFAARKGFTWTVLDPASRAVIGCVYMYPSEVADSPPGQITVRSWVRADRSWLDAELYRLVSAWIARDWPWANVAYAAPLRDSCIAGPRIRENPQIRRSVRLRSNEHLTLFGRGQLLSSQYLSGSR